MKKVENLKREQDAKAYINPEIGLEHKEKGNELFRAGDFPGAVKEFDEAIKRDPTNASYYSNRSFAYIKLMEPVRGKEDAEKCLWLEGCTSCMAQATPPVTHRFWYDPVTGRSRTVHQTREGSEPKP